MRGARILFEVALILFSLSSAYAVESGLYIYSVEVNGQNLSLENPVILVPPGQTIQGKIIGKNCEGATCSGCCINPIVGANSWEVDNYTGIATYCLNDACQDFEWEFSYTAPTMPGTYYIAVLRDACYSYEDVVYCTNGCCPGCGSLWEDSDWSDGIGCRPLNNTFVIKVLPFPLPYIHVKITNITGENLLPENLRRSAVAVYLNNSGNIDASCTVEVNITGPKNIQENGSIEIPAGEENNIAWYWENLTFGSYNVSAWVYCNGELEDYASKIVEMGFRETVCEEGYTGNKRCYGNVVQREYQYSNCTKVWRDYEDCDEKDGFYGDKYCKGDNVYRKYRDYYCSNGECVYNEEERLVKECEYGCENGKCKESAEFPPQIEELIKELEKSHKEAREHAPEKCSNCHEAPDIESLRKIHKNAIEKFEGHKEMCRECHSAWSCSRCHEAPDFITGISKENLIFEEEFNYYSVDELTVKGWEILGKRPDRVSVKNSLLNVYPGGGVSIKRKIVLPSSFVVEIKARSPDNSRIYFSIGNGIDRVIIDDNPNEGWFYVGVGGKWPGKKLYKGSDKLTDLKEFQIYTIAIENGNVMVYKNDELIGERYVESFKGGGTFTLYTTSFWNTRFQIDYIKILAKQTSNITASSPQKQKEKYISVVSSPKHEQEEEKKSFIEIISNIIKKILKVLLAW